MQYLPILPNLGLKDRPKLPSDFLVVYITLQISIKLSGNAPACLGNYLNELNLVICWWCMHILLILIWVNSSIWKLQLKLHTCNY